MSDKPELSKQEMAYNKRQEQRRAKLERVTEQYAMLWASNPVAYELVNDMLDIHLEALYNNMGFGDSDLVFKASGGISAVRELKEKLNIYKDYS